MQARNLTSRTCNPQNAPPCEEVHGSGTFITHMQLCFSKEGKRVSPCCHSHVQYGGTPPLCGHRRTAAPPEVSIHAGSSRAT